MGALVLIDSLQNLDVTLRFRSPPWCVKGRCEGARLLKENEEKLGIFVWSQSSKNTGKYYDAILYWKALRQSQIIFYLYIQSS